MAETRELSVRECQDLLRAGVAGRVAVSTPTGPHIVPVNYTVVDDAIVIRTSPYSLLGTYGRDTTFAFEIDEFDRDRARGWSVQARGRVEGVTDRAELEQIREDGRAPTLGGRLPAALPEAALDRAQRPPGRRAAGTRRTAHCRGEPTRAPTPRRCRGGAARGGQRDLLRPGPAQRADADRRGGHQADRGEVRRARGHRRRRLARGVRDHRDRRGDAPSDRRPPPWPGHPRPADPRARGPPDGRARGPPGLGRLPAAPPADGHLSRRTRADPGHRLRQPLPDREARRPRVHRAGRAAGRGAGACRRLRHRERPRLRPQRTPSPVAGGVGAADRDAAAADRARPGAAGHHRPGAVGVRRPRHRPARRARPGRRRLPPGRLLRGRGQRAGRQRADADLPRARPLRARAGGAAASTTWRRS